MRKTPNILLFFVDQQRFDTVGALGNPIIRTPHLDRICREGVAFTSAYSPSPVCVAARCSLIHGQYPLHTGCYANGRMPEDRESMMDALSRAGYRTHGIGKCHFTPDSYALRGFQTRERQEECRTSPDDDDYIAFLHAHGQTQVFEPHGVRGEMYYVPQLSQLPASLHPTQWIGDRSVDFVRNQTENQPWFLFSSFIHPHPPFAPPTPWHKLYRAALMPLPNVPPEWESLLTYVNRVQNRYKYRDQGIDNNLLRCMKAYYYACISFIDYQVGRVLAALAESGQLNDTLIIYTTDHGEHLGDRCCFGKRSMHDSCARIPLLARLPGRFPAGAACDLPVSLVDVAPTVLGIAGARVDSHALDGIDLTRAVAKEDVDRHRVFGQLAHPQGQTTEERAQSSLYMAVSRRWKYVYSAADGREFLFDRLHDPLETRNRAGVVFCRTALEDMRSALITHLVDGGECGGIVDGGWRHFEPKTMPEDPDSMLLIQDPGGVDMSIPGYSDSVV